jgi:hypothetical protein
MRPGVLQGQAGCPSLTASTTDTTSREALRGVAATAAPLAAARAALPHGALAQGTVPGVRGAHSPGPIAASCDGVVGSAHDRARPA